MITATDWRPRVSNTLQGFVNLALDPSGLVLRDCTLHQKSERRWVGLPGKLQVDAEGRARKDPTTAKPLYSPVVEIPDRECRDRFQAAALAAIDLLHGEVPR
jgi:hypothetical protein